MKGRIFIFGDNIDTDVIAPGGVLHKGIQEVLKHSMEAIFPNFYTVVVPGDVIVAGRNFGCGSSREQAAIVLRDMGISLVLAESFSRIFFRNAVNVGLSLGIVPSGLPLQNGDLVSYSPKDGILNDTVHKIVYRFKAPSGPLAEIIEIGGLINYVKRRLGPAESTGNHH